jgi:hypothetical protein
LSSTRETPGWCPFAPDVHGFAGKAHRKFPEFSRCKRSARVSGS